MTGTKEPASNVKFRRWTDLLATLLVRRHPASFADLVEDVPGYRAAKRGKKEKESVARTFERDKDELRAFGVAIETITDSDGNAVGYTLRSHDFYLPYLVLRETSGRTTRPKRIDKYGYHGLKELAFEPDELDAVVKAGDRVQKLGDPSLADAARSAVRKLAVDLPVAGASIDGIEEIVASEHPDPRIFPVLNRGLLARKKVTFDYRSMADGLSKTRTADPFGIFYLNGHWYLAAADDGAAVVKNFRLSRMSRVTVNAKAPRKADFTVPESFHLRDHARSRQAWQLGDADALDAIVEFSAQTGAVSVALQLGAPVAGQPKQRSFTIRREDAFVRWLLSFGGVAKPVSPPRLVERFQQMIRETLALYGPRA